MEHNNYDLAPGNVRTGVKFIEQSLWCEVFDEMLLSTPLRATVTLVIVAAFMVQLLFAVII